MRWSKPDIRRGTTNLHNHLESKHPSSVAECSGKEAGKKQLTLGDCKKCPPKRAKNITVRVAEYIARNLRPISTVDGRGYQQLLQYIEPGYKVPSRPFVTTTCHRLYTSLTVCSRFLHQQTYMLLSPLIHGPVERLKVILQ